ncbi:MAG: AraC family transcriptional regulator [Anaerolineae bacterium]|nr:AraC family transcriptional regulator [Anaerolineae bacterium]
MFNDPFSDVLKLVNAETVVSGGFKAGGKWAVRFPKMEKIKFSAVLQGSYWLLTNEQPYPILVEAGDVILLSTQSPFILANDLETTAVEAEKIFHPELKITQIGAGEACFQIGGFVRFDQINGNFVADLIPPLIHVKSNEPQAAILHWIVNQLVFEQDADLPGNSLVSAQLAQLLFIHLLRAYLATAGDLSAGLLKTLNNPLLGPALRLLHSDPARDWHLEELAKAASMSRTTFAFHFKQAAGKTAFAYLTEWRMRLAERALRTGTQSISEVAHSLGYSSESAFSNAFKRVVGQSPRRYREKVIHNLIL